MPPSSDPTARDFVPGPFSFPRLKHTYDSTIAPDVAIALYRILQEALTNIVKYAKAKNVHIDLVVASDNVTLLIDDDGIGIADNARHDRLSHGIAGMRQRVKGLHGEFSIGRRATGGTMIEVNIPLPGDANATTAAAPIVEA